MSLSFLQEMSLSVFDWFTLTTSSESCNHLGTLYQNIWLSHAHLRATLSSFVYLGTNHWLFDKVSQNLSKDLMKYIFYYLIINLKTIARIKKKYMKFTNKIYLTPKRSWIYTQVRLRVVFKNELSLCRLYNFLFVQLLPIPAPKGATGVSEIVNWSPDIQPTFSASAFLCGSFAGVSWPVIWASAISAARIVLSSINE